MRETPGAELPDFREMMVTVTNNSTIRLRKKVYSVPARLIDQKLLAREHENRIEILAGAEVVVELPVERGGRGSAIDDRHVIGHLLRKPGAFANDRWREEMFPSPIFRSAHDWLERREPVTASRRYLDILKLAADEGETAVENALEQLLANPRGVVSVREVRAMLVTWNALKTECRNCPPLEVDLSDYDRLLDGFEDFTRDDGKEGEKEGEKEGWSHRQVLRDLCESESWDRGERKTARLLAESGLPEGKTLGSLDEAQLPEN